ncbi:MAG: FtsX-like permease family protein [Actinocatenispora sp.]
MTVQQHSGTPAAISGPDAPSTGHRRPGLVARWRRDLGLGVRLVAGGGRSTWTRMVMTAVGVGLGVGLLLLASSVPSILASRSARNDSRVYLPSMHRTAHSVLMADMATDFQDKSISGFLIQAESPDPVVPPGLTKVPAPGELVVSPALRDLLASPGSALLRDRIPYRHITGTIADSGLSGANEYYYYAGTDTLNGDFRGFRVRGFGASSPPHSTDPVLLLITVVGVTVLLLPVAVFIGAAVRFGAESRDRQQAALRLVGADRRMTRRIAAGEALVGSALGLLVGVVIFLVGRQLVEHVTLMRVSVFAGDVRPNLVLALLIVLGLPASAVVVSMVALRRVVAEPLGVVRRATGRKRRLWWRLVPPAVGVALLLPLTGGMPSEIGMVTEVQIAAGITLLLVGMTMLLPWVVEATVRRLGGGGVPWQLAIRRLQLESGSAARVVGAITVAVAGAIALQTLFAGVQHQYVNSTHEDPHRAQFEIQTAGNVDGTERARIQDRLRSTPGTRSVISFYEGVLSSQASDDAMTTMNLIVGDCGTLRELARIDHCTDGDAFTAATDEGTKVRPGESVSVDGLGPKRDTSVKWRVPAAVTAVGPRYDPGGSMHSGVLLTPAALRASGLQPSFQATFYLRTDLGRTDAADQVRTTAAEVDPLMYILMLERRTTDETFGSIHRGLFIGATAVLLLIGASLLVTTLEQLRERQRPLAVLAAFGGRRRTLSLSVLWQTAIPVVFGLGLAVIAGTVLGGVLLRISGEPLWFDWVSTAGIVGIGAGVVMLVTLLSMPALWRLMRPEGMRTE